MLSGFATPTGTARFGARFPELGHVHHFRQPQHVKHLSELWCSSLGLGTYLGEADAATDRRYTEAIIEALNCGVNVVDSAINYRLQRSERSIGAALSRAVELGNVQREELLICTKAGYLTYESTVPADPRRYFLEEYIEAGVIPRDELVGGMHCIAPEYLKNQIERSRRNLDIDTIDIFYLHNPEQQLSEVSREEFRTRLRKAFGALEGQAAAGRIRVYGTATWNGYRQAASSHEYLSLWDIAEIAREVGGDNHHFRAVQLPFNLGLPEAFTNENQKVGSKQMALLAAAQELGIAVITSAALLQGRLSTGLPEFVRERMKFDTDVEAAIQFARSAPGVTTALIGMSRKEHVQANMKVASHQIAPAKSWESLFQVENRRQ
jgi:aryl-alcohol dehydrogenase-like predicted oxidoreductase